MSRLPEQHGGDRGDGLGHGGDAERGRDLIVLASAACEAPEGASVEEPPTARDGGDDRGEQTWFDGPSQQAVERAPVHR